MKQVVKQRAIPFVISCERISPVINQGLKMDDLYERRRTAKRFAEEMRASSERDWAIEEINAEISAARKARRATR